MAGAIGLKVDITAVSALAGVVVPNDLSGVREAAARVSRADGTAVAGLTTDLALETRATAASPWVEVMGLNNDPSDVPVPVSTLRVRGVLDPADDPAIVQIFGRT